MSTIYTRATKGSALTWTEGDANITNLNNDKLEDITNESIGDLSDVVITTPATGEILIYSGTNWINGSAGIDAVIDDTAPQLGGDLDVNGNSIVSTANGNIAITPNGTGSIVLDGLNWPQADGTSNQVLKTDGAGNLSFTTVSGASPAGSNQQIQFNNSGAFGASSGLYYDGTSLKVTSGNIESLYSNGDEGGEFRLATATTNTTLAGGSIAIDVYQNRLRIFETGGSTRGVYLDLAGAADTVGSALAVQGTTASFSTLTSTGSIAFKDTRETIYDLGTTGGTIAPNPANGSVQKITLNSALTMNAFTSPVAGQSLTLIIYGGTAYTSITSTMKFAGGIKTLTGTAGCIDILSVYYDGTNYFASLGKGFA